MAQPLPEPPAPSLAQGIAIILATVFAMALTDALIKLASSGMPLWQIWVLRSGIVLPVLLVATGGRVLAPGQGRGDLGWIALRSLALVAQYICLYAVLPLIDMALAGAAFYTAPFFIAGLAALVLGNRILPGHWLAIATGFAGLLVILRPFGADFTPLVLMPVAAALFYAVAAIVTRARCAKTPALLLALWLNLTCLAGGLVLAALGAMFQTPDWTFFLFGPWHPTVAKDWGLVLVLAVLILGVAVGLAKAYQNPRPEVIAVFDYGYMVFVVFWGFVFFGERPDGWTVLGVVLIVAGGLAMVLIKDRGGDRGGRKA